MAKILYEVYQNTAETSKAYGKYFARAKSIETLNTRKMSEHISEHGSVYTTDVVQGVMEKFRKCLLEQLLNSRKVKVDGLGIFYTTIECSKGGSNSEKDFNAGKHIRGLHIRFLPDQEAETNISSREFIKKAQFINVDTLTRGAEEDEPEGGEGGEG